jgi:hypothetical protein
MEKNAIGLIKEPGRSECSNDKPAAPVTNSFFEKVYLENFFSLIWDT